MEVSSKEISEFSRSIVFLNEMSFLSFLIENVEETMKQIDEQKTVGENNVVASILLETLPKMKQQLSEIEKTERNEEKKLQVKQIVSETEKIIDTVMENLSKGNFQNFSSLQRKLESSLTQLKEISPTLQNTLKMIGLHKNLISHSQFFVQNGLRVVLDPGNSFLGVQFTINCKNVEDEIEKLVDSALNLSVGREQVNSFLKLVDNYVIDLDTTNISSKMGLVEKPKNVNISSLQEDLSVNTEKIFESLDHMLLCAKNSDSFSFAQGFEPFSDLLGNFVQISKFIASLSTDEKQEQLHLEKTTSTLKQVALFASESIVFTENPNDPNQIQKLEECIATTKQVFSKMFEEKSKQEEIKQFCEQSIEKIKTSTSLPQSEKQSYSESKENLISAAKQVALSSQKLLNSKNLEFGENSKTFSDCISSMSVFVSHTVSSIDVQEIQEKIKSNWNNLCTLSTSFIEKGNEIKEQKQRKTEMTKIFREICENLSKIIQSVGEAASGEKKCIECSDRLRKIQSNIEASLLLSEIGSSSQKIQSTDSSFTEKLHDIYNSCLPLSSDLLKQQSQTSLGKNFFILIFILFYCFYFYF